MCPSQWKKLFDVQWTYSPLWAAVASAVAVAAEPAETAVVAVETPWAAFPSAVSAEHTDLELPEQAELQTVLAVA